MCVCLTSCPLFLGLAPDSKQDEDELLNNYYTNKEQIGNHIYISSKTSRTSCFSFSFINDYMLILH